MNRHKDKNRVLKYEKSSFDHFAVCGFCVFNWFEITKGLYFMSDDESENWNQKESDVNGCKIKVKLVWRSKYNSSLGNSTEDNKTK